MRRDRTLARKRGTNRLGDRPGSSKIRALSGFASGPFNSRNYYFLFNFKLITGLHNNSRGTGADQPPQISLLASLASPSFSAADRLAASCRGSRFSGAIIVAFSKLIAMR